jgi:hypothetical protein
MAEPRKLESLSAGVETEEGTNSYGQRRGGISTGRVQLRAVPSWLKNGVVVTASLAPDEARKLATDLLVAAERAEGRSVIR